MGLIWVVVTAIIAYIGVVFSRVLADDFKAWRPRIVEWLIQLAARKLPEEYRDRIAEEWRSHNAEMPGEIAKLCDAISLLWAHRRMPKPIVDEPIVEDLDEPSAEDLDNIAFLNSLAQSIKDLFGQAPQAPPEPRAPMSFVLGTDMTDIHLGVARRRFHAALGWYGGEPRWPCSSVSTAPMPANVSTIILPGDCGERRVLIQTK